jgi:hypothetical protein
MCSINMQLSDLHIFALHRPSHVDRDSVVGMATCYGLKDPGEIFITRSDRPLGAPSLLYNGYRLCLLAVHPSGQSVNHPPSSNTKVKEELGLYLFSAYEPSWHISE